MKKLLQTAVTCYFLLQGTFLPAQERVQSTVADAGNTIIWTISEPNVKQASEQFHQITFLKNDEVYITAGGCAQTGGVNKTWKRYVNPSGPNSDRLYSGLISIPGVTLGMGRIGLYVNKTMFVPNSPNLPANMFLTLGYQDDDYSDNGYWSHDDGTEDQCKGVGNAWLTVKITHHSSPPSSTAQTFKPFDVVATDWDVNGLPLNPKFGGQLSPAGGLPSLVGLGTNFFPNATSFPVTIESNDICSNSSRTAIDFFSALIIGAFDGLVDGHLGDRSGYPGDHINFMPVAYQGTVNWDSHSKDDDDYNFKLARADQACYTKEDNSLLTEFDSDETVDHYDNTSSWWEDFHHNGVDNSDAAAEAKVQKISDVFIIGLLGIDAQHGPHFELHPAFAVFMREATPATDNYHFFIRNWGDEGYCSEHKQYLDLNSIQVLIPNAAALTGNNVSCGSSGDNIAGMSWQSVPVAGGVLLTFNLKNPDQNSWYEGDLNFTRKVPLQAITPLVHPTMMERSHPLSRTAKAGALSVEEILDKKIASLPSDAKARLYAELKGAPIITKSFRIQPIVHQSMATAIQRHSAVPVVINKNYVRVRPSPISNKKSSAETIQILAKYFPPKK